MMSINSDISKLPPKKQFLHRYLESISSASKLVISNVFSLQKSSKGIWRPFDEPHSETDEETTLLDSEGSLKTDGLSECNSSDIVDLTDIDDHLPATSTPIKKIALPSSKRVRMNDANQKLNDKYIRLLMARAKERNQSKIICRYYQCNKCNFKTYIKRVLEHHLTCHVKCTKNDVTISLNVFRRKENE